MTRKSTIPEDILNHVPYKCCRVRNDGDGVYRVYKYSAIKLPSGKWSSDYSYLIGKILSDKGFIPNKRYLKELGEQGTVTFSDGITDITYGQHALLHHLSNDVLEKLEVCFSGERTAQIYSYALIICANGFVHINQTDDFYQESFLYVMYRDYAFIMGYTALTNLHHDFGLRGNPVKTLEQSLISNISKNNAIDGHAIRSSSAENELAEPGYKRNLLKAPHVNPLIARDINNKILLMYRTYRGSRVNKSSVLVFLHSRSFADTKIIVDNGFYSNSVLCLCVKIGTVISSLFLQTINISARLKRHSLIHPENLFTNPAKRLCQDRVL